MEIFYILAVPMTFAIVVMSVGAYFASRKEKIKPLVKFTSEVIAATFYFDNGDSLKKEFQTFIYKKSRVVYNRILYYYQTKDADKNLLEYLEKINKVGFIFVDDDTLVPISKISQIGLERSETVIEVESL
jgi:hypothetical protein